MKNFIRKWLGLPTVADDPFGVNPTMPAGLRAAEDPPHGAFRVNITPASNGSIIELMVHRPNNQKRSDWTTEYIVVPRGESVSEVLVTAITAARLEEA